MLRKKRTTQSSFGSRDPGGGEGRIGPFPVGMAAPSRGGPIPTRGGLIRPGTNVLVRVASVVNRGTRVLEHVQDIVERVNVF